MQQSLDSSAMAGQNWIFPFASGLNAYKPDSTKKNRLVLICPLDYQIYNCTATAVNGAQV
jgi:hypothetical protein